MTIPTRIIERDEFNELMAQEGDILPLFKLTAHTFAPPRPDNLGAHFQEVPGINVLLLNVAEPVIYKDKAAGMAFVCINGYDSDTSFTYENFQDCHIVKGAWYYRLAPSYWDAADGDCDLEDCIFRFAPVELPAWEVGN